MSVVLAVSVSTFRLISTNVPLFVLDFALFNWRMPSIAG
jgi:hypothetical protein